MKRRRGNGEGTVTRRPDGRWMAQLSYVNKAGERKRWTAYAKTRKEADEKLTRAKADLQQGTFVEPSKLTVEQWLDTWLREYKKPALRPEVYANYEMLARVHIKPALGHIPLQNLRPEAVQRFYNEKAASGLAPATVRRIHQVLHGALKQAVRNQLVVRNAAEGAVLPKPSPRKIRALTQEEQKLFLAALKGHRLSAAFKTLLGTGLRRGELLALTWTDIDLADATLTVRRDVVRAPKAGLVFQAPKTPKSNRTIPLPAALVAALKAHKARQARERLEAGPAYEDHGLVFADEFGKPLCPRGFNDYFYELRAKAGLPKEVNLHALRHTYATRLLERGVPMKTVQELMGHASYRITADTYCHVAPQLKREAAAAINDIFGAAKKDASPGPHSQEEA